MTSSNDSYSPGSSTCMQEVSAQQDESSVGLFRCAGCVSSPSPLLLSLSPSFLPSFLCPCLPSPSLFLPPSILATPSYIIYPRALIIQQRPQQTNICQDDPRLNAWRRHQHHQKSSNSADTCYVCSWCSVKVRTNNNISTWKAQNYQAPFCYKN